MKLETSNLSCGFKDKTVLSGINLTVESGDICCILGENGVGKSTLFKTLLGVIPPVAGSIYLGGKELGTISRREIASMMAYVPQNHNPAFNYLVSEVIMMGRYGNSKPFLLPNSDDNEAVEKIAEEMGVSHLLDKPYMNISGGERQKVLICKALAQNPDILVFDEPTANLDYGNQVVLLDAISELSDKGIMILLTTHSPEQALLLNANTLLLSKTSDPQYGSAASIITEKNLSEVYGKRIRVIDIVTEEGNPMRCCIPEIGRKS